MVFYAKIGSEKGEFDIVDVINSLCEKLIYRHPHIYGEPKQMMQKRETKLGKLKLIEGNKSVLSGVPKGGFPSMIKAYRIQDKVERRGV